MKNIEKDMEWEKMMEEFNEMFPMSESEKADIEKEKERRNLWIQEMADKY